MNISTFYPIVKILTDFIIIPVSILLFNEKINIYNYIGLATGSLSIYLLSIQTK